jgi:hypothetical protein
MKNVKKVALKYVKFGEDSPAIKEEYNEAVKFIASSEIVKSETEKLNKNKENQEYVMNFAFGSMFGLVMPYITKPSEKSQEDTVKSLGKFNKKNDKGQVPMVMILKGGSIMLGILNKIKKSDEMKDADKDAKNILAAAICSVKHFISLWKNIQKAYPSDGDDDGDKKDDGDEEDKPKKKKKSKKDEDAEDDE